MRLPATPKPDTAQDATMASDMKAIEMPLPTTPNPAVAPNARAMDFDMNNTKMPLPATPKPDIAQDAQYIRLIPKTKILQQIATLLPTDRDILHFSQACKKMWTQVYASESAVWRNLFAKRYDILSVRPSTEFRNEYLIRVIVLNASINFSEKEDDRQHMCMEVMRTMLEEAITAHLKPESSSKTLFRLRESLKTMNFLKCLQKENPSELFFALQLAMTPLALDLDITRACHRDHYNLATIYSFDEQLNMPYIDKTQLNLDKLLQIRSFWQRHLLTESEFTYYETFAALPSHLKPGVRKADPKDGSNLSASWLGLYSCLHPLPDSLEELAQLNRQTCADMENHVDMIDIMNLEIEAQPGVDVFWPEVCTMIAPPVGPETDRMYFQGKQGIHGPPGEEENTVFGFTEDIHTTYGGIGGWKRICFTICQGNTSTTFQSKLAGDEWVHCYEALIIPGGRLMLGRWVDMKNETGRGPFIFWDL
ncbi:uncharacterized protein N7511_006573 [Penicillium nucicola]|uniref:uncharacterized protein n=1 Tax=Penicillium nucicola TaxID=1850975 RepID=UPI00254592B9|nr:uncharacterized protein N7511_006573 [Penicillium nucicola]KAJ5757879.1 hypothetical protein N7511_006573 [Penicillium nucicola]